MPSPGELAGALAGPLLRNSSPPPGSKAAGAGVAVAVDASSGADLVLLDAYLQQLLPALAKAKDAGRQSGGSADSLGLLGLDRSALASAGVPQHTVNALYRAMAAHAGAFRKMVAGEVQQLRSLLAQQAGPQLSATIQLLDGPITASGTGTAGTQPNRAAAAGAADLQPLPALAAAAAAAAAEEAEANDTGHPGPMDSSGGVPGMGPTPNDLVKDYADAYANMKETMDIRLRHELRRGDFLQSKLQQTEAILRDTGAQLDAANRRITEQRSELDTLATEQAGLQQDLASSHAAHLALQQHHKAQMEAWQSERQATEQQHKQQLEALQQELSAASGAAAALVETNRQVEALRMLYNEELGRASRLAVELSKATAAADKAAAQEAVWAKQIACSDTRADNAEGMASALGVTVKQVEVQLKQQQEQLATKEVEAEKLRLSLERSRLTAVAEAAAARATTANLSKQVKDSNAQVAEKASLLASTQDAIKARQMELEGANAQLQAGRSHLKQMMADLEAEQEKTASLTATLEDSKVELAAATSAMEVAEARLKSTQKQLHKANEATATLQEKIQELELTMEERAVAHLKLQVSFEEVSSTHADLEAEAGTLRTRLSDLVGVQQQLAELQVEHQAATARVNQLEQEHEELAEKAEKLAITTYELQELQEQRASLRSALDEVQQELVTTSDQLEKSRADAKANAARVGLLEEELEAANMQKAQVTRELVSTSEAGASAQQDIANLTQQLDDVQAALEAAETDRQVLAAQRDGWMASFQEAYGKLQEWTVSSESAARKLAARASALQEAMQCLGDQAQAGTAAADSCAATNSSDGTSAAATATAAAAKEVMDQLAGLQQLVRAEGHKQQEVFDNTLKGLSQKVQERHQAAQASWQHTMAAANARRAARALARAAERKKRQSLMAVAAAHSHAVKVAAASGDGQASTAERQPEVQRHQQLQQQLLPQQLPQPPQPGAAIHVQQQQYPAVPAAVGAPAAAEEAGPALQPSEQRQDLQKVSSELPPCSNSAQPNESDASVATLSRAVDAATTAAAAMAVEPAASGTSSQLPAVTAPAIASGSQAVHGPAAIDAAAAAQLGDSQQQLQRCSPEEQQASAAIAADAAALTAESMKQATRIQHASSNIMADYVAGSSAPPAASTTHSPVGIVSKPAEAAVGQHRQLQQRQQLQQLLPQSTHVVVQPKQTQDVAQQQMLLQQQAIQYQHLLVQHRALQQQHQMLLQKHHPQQPRQQQAPPLLQQQQQALATATTTHHIAEGIHQSSTECASSRSSGSSSEAVTRPSAANNNSIAEGTTEQGLVSTADSPRSTDADGICMDHVAPGGDIPTAGVRQVTSAHKVTHTTTITVTSSISTSDVTAAALQASSADDAWGPDGSTVRGSDSSSSHQVVTVSCMQHSASMSAVTGMTGSGEVASQRGYSPNQADTGEPGADWAGGLDDNYVAADGVEGGAQPMAPLTALLPQAASTLSAEAAQWPVAPLMAGFNPPLVGAVDAAQCRGSSTPAAVQAQVAGMGHMPHLAVTVDTSASALAPFGSTLFNSTAGLSSLAGSPGLGYDASGVAASLTFNGQGFGSLDSMGGLSSGCGSPAVVPGMPGSDGYGFGGLSSPGAHAAGGFSGGGALSGFVSMATYQEQMQSVANLHGQVGQMVVQLREAHADAEGAQQQLQQERQEATTRTNALRDALGKVHTQLEELRDDHEQLQESHRTLMARDLLKSGLLRDRYVADLFKRLQEALWKLDTARKRATTWGFDMLVPLGRTDRGIQTQAGEIWAAVQATTAFTKATATAALTQGATVSKKQQKPFVEACSSSGMLEPGDDLSADADPEAAAVSIFNSSNSAGQVDRKKPAFTQHSSSSNSSSNQPQQRVGHAGKSEVGLSSAAVSQATPAALLESAEQLLAAGTVQLPPQGELLRLIASLYSAKAAADARALRSHSTTLGMWDFIMKYLMQANADSSSSDSSSGGSCKDNSNSVSHGSGSISQAATALAQLLGSVRQHADSCREISAFAAALEDSMPCSSTQQPSRPHSADGSSGSAASSSRAVECRRSRSTTPRSSGRVGLTYKGSWGEVHLDDGKLLPPARPDLLLPAGTGGLMQRVMEWPGMSALLGWVAGGHFLGGLGPNDLGHALLDVQAPHVHFLLLEAADILHLHPLPRVHVVQASAAFARMLRIPTGLPAAKRPNRTGASSSGGGASSRRPADTAALKCQRLPLLVLSSAALHLLQPAELQAAMAGALGPLALEGGSDEDEGGPSSCGTSQLMEPDGPTLADLSTLASLLALVPAFLLAHLPPEMHAMGHCLTAALLAIDRLVGVAGDRAGLLVSQDLTAALTGLLKTAGSAADVAAAAAAANDEHSGCLGSEDDAAAASKVGRGVLVQSWQGRIRSEQQGHGLASIEQLLPQHEKLVAASRRGAGEFPGFSTVGQGSLQEDQLSDEQVLLLRVRELLSWADSPEYADMMAAARPLRRVLRPSSSSTRIKSA